MNATLGDPRLPERFWAKVELGTVPEWRPDLDECWIWTGASRGQGNYGGLGIRVNGRAVKVLAHRFAYLVLVGPIPDGLTIDHLCRVPKCVNTSHMEVVTQAENNARKPASLVTECPRGHPYNETNMFRGSSNGRRNCRTCERARKRVPDALLQRPRPKPGDRRLAPSVLVGLSTP